MSNTLIKVKLKNYARIIFILIILITQIIAINTNSAANNNRETISPITTKALLPSDIIFNYNDSYSKDTFNYVVNGLELGKFNSLTFSFVSSGDKSTRHKLKVIFLINEEANVSFTIETIYQDQNEHSLTKAFYLNSAINDNINLTIIIEGQASFGSHGSLRIFNNIIIKMENIPQLCDNNTKFLPVFPSFIEFKGDLFKQKYLSVASAMINTLEPYQLGLTLSFTSNIFDATSNHVELQVNGSVVSIHEFEPGKNNNLSFSINPRKGLLNISITFVVYDTLDLISLTDIKIAVYPVYLDSSSLGGIFLEHTWSGTILSSEFDLTELRPKTESNIQIIKLSLNCKLVGNTFPQGLNYELISGLTKIADGVISESKQQQELFNINISTYTYTYKSRLSLKIHGELNEGEKGHGSFIIYNSSNIIAENVPELKVGEELKRTLGSSPEIKTVSIGATTIVFKDIFYISYSQIIIYDFSLFFNLLSKYNMNIDHIAIDISIGLNATISKVMKEIGTHKVADRIKLYQGYNEVIISMNIYGNGALVKINDILYNINSIGDQSSDNNKQSTINNIPVFKPPLTVTMGIVTLSTQWIILSLFVLIFNKKRKLKKKGTRYVTEGYKLEIDT